MADSKFNQKAVIIGLDGIPCSLLESYMAKGIMPRFQEMAATGQLLPMKSTLPEVSSVAWSSFMTGKNPAEHGIFGFMELDRNTYEYRFPNFDSLKAPPFWEELGLATVVLNIPQTYPARPINGILVSGFVALDLEKAVYPRRIFTYLRDADYRLDVKSQLAATDPAAFFEDLFAVFKKRIAAIKYLYDHELWQLFIGTITETDRLHHFFYDSSAGGPYYDMFIDFYTALDTFLGEMFDRAQRDQALFFTCSDHGFAAIKTEVYVNRLLQNHGLLKISGNDGFKGIAADSQSFCLDPARVYVHLQGKYARGTVNPTEYERLRSDIKALFDSLTFDGLKVVRQVYFKEEIFTGKNLDEAPDLYILAEPGFDLKAALNRDSIFGLSHFRGAHTYQDAHLFISRRIILAAPTDFSIAFVPKIIKSYFSQ
jgi:predicted AlkP superfamily phosphohydrolase/phosphomutase